MSKKLKINFVLPYAGFAGGTRVVAIYADRLQKLGHDVHIYSTPRKDPGLKSKLKSLLKGQGWPKLVGGSHVDRVAVPRTIIDAWRPMTDRDIRDADVTIATWWETAEWVAALSSSKGEKVNFLQHDEQVLVTEKDRAIAVWSLPMHKICVARWLFDLAKARPVTSVSARPEPRFEAVHLVPNAVDLDQFYAPPREKNSEPTVGLMYSQARFKGADIALDAIRIARKSVRNLRVVSFGTQHPNEHLPLVEGTRYQIEPAQDQLREFYAACDAWLFASRSEGFGLPILEAMACRTPVIGTPAGAAPELLEESGGILVPVENPETMAQEIVRVAGMSTAEWKTLSDRAFQTASRHSWTEATRQFEAALQKITGV